MSHQAKCWNWGLIGPGRFAREFATELSRVGRARCLAVASRSPEKAAHFADQFGFEKAYDNYDSLIEDPEVEIVYIVLPHVFHREIAERALLAGKAVVCEKPLTHDLAETRALAKLARERGTFLMEAMKTGFLPAIQRARDWIAAGKIGEPKLMRADFCFFGPDDPADRLMNPDLGGGCLLDVGIYPIYLARLLLGEIEAVSAAGSMTNTGVEDSAAAVTRHENGAISSLTASFRTPESMGAVILGTEGQIEIPKFHAASQAHLQREDGGGEVYKDDSGTMVTPEINAVMESLDAGHSECPGHSLNDSLRLAELMDEALRQIRKDKKQD